MDRMVACVVSACAALAVTRVSGAEVDCGAMRAVFGPRGELERFVSAKGVDFLETRHARPEPLWQIRLCRPDDFAKTVDVSASAAKEVTVERDGGGLVITYRDAGAVREAKVTVHPDVADGKLRWRIAATPAEGWALYRTGFPRLRLTDSIGATGVDDAVLAGLGHAGILHNPSAPRWERGKSMLERAAAWARHSISARQPGELAAQFFTFWDVTSGFYTACEDGKGYVKELQFSKNYNDGGFSFEWRRFTYSENPDAQDYDVVTTAFEGDPMNPVDWRDAADLYKKWALTQHWCRTPLKYRTDLPAWAKDAPAMLAFYTSWVERPEKINDFFSEYWAKRFPGVPVAAALVGWEKHGEWIGIDYFPMHPSDEITSNTFRSIKKFGAHPWPWPSGHYWSTLRKPRGDGTFRFDQMKEFELMGGPKMVCVNPDGSLFTDRKSSWLAGGNRYCLCPGDEKVRDFWTKNVCVELVKRGAEMIQSDQDTGAHVPECWSRFHGHAPGEGLWKTMDMYCQFEETIAECRKLESNFIITFEEPNEHFNDLLFIQDHRNCRFNIRGHYDWEWADVFGYLYHEYVALFQSDVISGNSFWWTHAAVEGHMPYARFYDKELKFENAFPGKARAFLERWVDLYHREGRDWLAHGRHIRPPRYVCNKVPYDFNFRGEGRAVTDMPSVFCAAYESLDGVKAVVFGNATSNSQNVAYFWNGGWRKFVIGPQALHIEKVEDPK